MPHDDDDFSEGHDVDIKEYFKNLFKNKSHFWQQLKLLVTPDDDLYSRHSSVDAHIIKPAQEEDDEEPIEVEEVDPDILAPRVGRSGHNVPVGVVNEEADEIQAILDNKAVPLSYIKEITHEARKFIVHPPKKKQPAAAENSTPSEEEPSSTQLIQSSEPESH